MKPSVNYDFSKLDKFVTGISKKYVVKVGVLGNKVSRSDAGPLTNADIGAVHEFGSFSKRIPMRSFLRMPLHQRSSEILLAARKLAFKFLWAGKHVEALKVLGKSCEAVIADAFATNGWGMWPADKPATVKRKGHGQVLRDTGQLARSISSRVEAV